MTKTLYRTLVITSALALVVACSKQKTANDTGVTQQPDAHPAATVPTPANESKAVDFVPKAAASDMFEVQSSQAALKMSKNADIKMFAKMMIDAHTKSTADLKAAITASGQSITPPATLPDDLQKKLDDLKASKDFDKDYVSAQVDGHQAALDLMQRYANDGDVAQIKDFATKTAPVVQDHLTQIKALKDKMDAAK
jgi:putative membrane protein